MASRVYSGDGRRSENHPSEKIFVTRFDVHLDSEGLAKIFFDVGEVVKAHIVTTEKGTRYGFVTFKTLQEAEAAVRQFNGKPPLYLVVRFSEERCRDTYKDDNTNTGNDRNSRCPVDEPIKTICIHCHKEAVCQCSHCGVRFCVNKPKSQDGPKINIAPILKKNQKPQNGGEPSCNATQVKHVSFCQVESSDQETVKDSEIMTQATVSDPTVPVNKPSHNNQLSELLQRLRIVNASIRWKLTEQLPRGEFVEVTVVHVSDNMFYAIMASSLQTMTDIMAKANTPEANFSRLTKVEVGSLCLIKVNDLICRGIVESASPCAVRLLDFGYSIPATETEIFIAPEFFGKFRAQAICMTSKNIMNIKVIEFENITVQYSGEMLGGACLIAIKDKNSFVGTGQNSALAIPQSSPAHELNAGVDEKKPPTVLPISQPNATPKKISAEWTRCPGIPNESTEVLITHIDGNDIFVTILANEEICNLQLAAANSIPNRVPMGMLSPGRLCIVPFVDAYYRARIVSVEPVTAFLLDYGNTVSLSADEVSCPIEVLTSTESQAIHVRLAPGSERIFEELYEGLEVKMKAIKRVNDVYIVEVEGDAISQVYTGTTDNCSTNNSEVLQKRVLDNFIENASGNVQEHHEELSREWTRCPDLPTVYTKVSITHIDGNDIFVTIRRNKEICDLQFDAANSIPNRVPMGMLSPGRLCVVPFYNYFYRARIVSVKPVTAFLLDYGNTVSVSADEVWCPNNALASRESQAIHVRLAPGLERIFATLDENLVVKMKAIDKVNNIYIVELMDVN